MTTSVWSKFPPNAWRAILIGGLALHIILAASAAWIETPTVDEFAHVPAGMSYWKHGEWSLYSKNPPVLKLWMTLPVVLGIAGPANTPDVKVEPFRWGPWLYGAEFEKENSQNYLRIFFAARMMVIVLSSAAGLLIFLWANQLSGKIPAALAAFGFWLSPTVLAHGHLATVDIGAALVIFGLCYFLFAMPDKPKISTLLICGLLFGLALTTKFSSLFVLPLVVYVLATRAKGYRIKALAVSAISCLLAIQIVFGFSSLATFKKDYESKSKLGRRVVSLVPDWFPIPLPRYFIEGLDAQLADAETGEFGNYLNGEWSQTGWWYYNLESLGLKEHPASIVLIFLIPFAIRKKRFKTLLPIIGPLVLLAIPLLFLNPLQVGIRYLLPLFPFLFLLMAMIFDNFKIAMRLSPLILAAWTWSAIATAPHYLSYFNSIAREFGNPETLLLDSNFDWGQDLYRLKNMAAQATPPFGLMYFGHVSPAEYGISYQLIPDHPVEGLLAVSANLLEGMDYPVLAPDGTWVATEKDHLKWLRGLTPIRREGSIFIFDTRGTD